MEYFSLCLFFLWNFANARKIITNIRWKLIPTKSFPRIIEKIYRKLHAFHFFHRNCENNGPYTTNYTSHDTRILVSCDCFLSALKEHITKWILRHENQRTSNKNIQDMQRPTKILKDYRRTFICISTFILCVLHVYTIF